jgi:hypothetical protein
LQIYIWNGLNGVYLDGHLATAMMGNVMLIGLSGRCAVLTENQTVQTTCNRGRTASDASSKKTVQVEVPLVSPFGGSWG